MTGFVGWANAWTGINNAGVVELYSYSFFKAVGNMFPCAFPAQTAVEQLVASFYVIASAVLYAAFLGAISSATMSINPSGKLFTQKMDELSDYVKWKKLSPETTKKIFSYYETKYRGKYFEEDLLLLELNESLRKEISLQNTQALIERVPFLRRQMNDGRDEIFFARLATVLHANYFVKNDFIIKQGDYGFDMFFILSGMVNVIVNGKKVVSLYDGAYFGEVALLAKILRTSTVQATTPSVLYRLTYNDFHEVVNEFDDMKIRIQALTKEYEERLRNTASTEAAVNKLRKLDESDEAQKEQEDREMGETQ
ncbi:Potassium voltage-gated channel sub H member 7 [Rhizoclosmatium sp. JEL0117]|nr:Potassium voltage-gated channel sub H member 7 [Rhizoclosmatium sp. JEL0117]